jgi:hypothetical protein
MAAMKPALFRSMARPIAAALLFCIALSASAEKYQRWTEQQANAW